MFHRSIAAFLALGLIVGCAADPRSRCAPADARELRTINRLIADTRANLDRGYVISRPQMSPFFNICLGGGGDNIGVSMCADPSSFGGGRETVAFDRASEIRKLEALEARRDALQARSAAAGTTCGAIEEEE